MLTIERERAANLGHIFTAKTGSVAPGTAIGTTPPLALWNPQDSRFRLVLLQAVCGYVSGTLGAGHFQYAWAAQPNEPTTGTPLTPQSVSIGKAPAPTPLGKAYSLSTIVAPAALRPALAVPSPTDLALIDDPLITIDPGHVLSLEALAAAGSAPLVVLAFTWAEYRIG